MWWKIQVLSYRFAHVALSGRNLLHVRMSAKINFIHNCFYYFRRNDVIIWVLLRRTKIIVFDFLAEKIQRIIWMDKYIRRATFFYSCGLHASCTWSQRKQNLFWSSTVLFLLITSSFVKVEDDNNPLYIIIILFWLVLKSYISNLIYS